MRPRVLLFDEPTSALDPQLVGEVLGVIRALAHEHDLTMLLVTHEMRFAREVSDRVCFFDKGRIVEQGEPDRFFGAPEQPRTREFLSSILNTWPEKVSVAAASESETFSARRKNRTYLAA